jgi:hypothetical protein
MKKLPTQVHEAVLKHVPCGRNDNIKYERNAEAEGYGTREHRATPARSTCRGKCSKKMCT